MKRRLLFLFFSLFVTMLSAQQRDICNYLVETGRVDLRQDGRLTYLLGVKPKDYYAGAVSEAASTVDGYRIRVFSGNQQTVSKNRCYNIQAKILEEMPNLPTYVVFKTPNWRLSVGDYRSSEEAHAQLRVLRRTFPAYANEMFIVKEKVNL